MPFFSIIVPVYNVARFLRRCLESIANQDFKDWECVCIDDGSRDGSEAILDEYGKMDSRFKVFHQKNAGVSSARNLGVLHAKGEYLWFVDGDDVVMPLALCVLHNAARKLSNPDILAIRWREFSDSAEGVISEAQKDNKTLKCNDVKAVLNLYSAREVFALYAGSLIGWNALYRREAVTGLRFHSYPNGEDILWGIESILAATSFGSVSNVCYGYYQRENSACRKLDERHLVSSLAVAGEIVQRVRTSCWGEGLEDILLPKVRTILNSVAYQPVRMLGRRGYEIWIEYARHIYIDAGLLTGCSKSLMEALIKTRSRMLIWLFCFFPPQAKGWLLKNRIVSRMNDFKNRRRVQRVAI